MGDISQFTLGADTTLQLTPLDSGEIIGSPVPSDMFLGFEDIPLAEQPGAPTDFSKTVFQTGEKIGSEIVKGLGDLTEFIIGKTVEKVTGQKRKPHHRAQNLGWGWIIAIAGIGIGIIVLATAKRRG